MPQATPTQADAAPTVKQAPDEARGRTPTRGARRRAGIGRRRDRRARPGLRAVDRRRRRVRARRSTSATSAVPTTSTTDGRADPQRTGTRAPEAAGETVVKFTIQRDGTHHGRRRRASRAATRARPQRAARRGRARGSCRRCRRRFPNPTLTVHLNFRVHTMTQTFLIVDSSRPRRPARGAGRRSSRRRRQRRRTPQQPSEISTTISSGERRRAAAVRGARTSSRSSATTPETRRRGARRSRACCGTT